MNTQKIAKGWALIAEGAMELSLAYESLDTPAARAGVDTAAEGATALPPSPSSAAAIPLKPQVDAGLGICPIHGTSWSIKPAGISPRTKEAYDAFYRCVEKDEEGNYCKQKPQKVWRDAHPIQGSAAA